MTQKEFATKAGLRNEYISRYIKGVCIPGRATLTKIANTYNIDPGWLMGFGPDDLIER
jgi:transcriptional regulator with XRE-family HTH domain